MLINYDICFSYMSIFKIRKLEKSNIFLDVFINRIKFLIAYINQYLNKELAKKISSKYDANILKQKIIYQLYKSLV